MPDAMYYERVINDINKKIAELQNEKAKAEGMLESLKAQYVKLVGELPDSFEDELDKLESEKEKLKEEIDDEIRRLRADYPTIFE